MFTGVFGGQRSGAIFGPCTGASAIAHVLAIATLNNDIEGLDLDDQGSEKESGRENREKRGKRGNKVKARAEVRDEWLC